MSGSAGSHWKVANYLSGHTKASSCDHQPSHHYAHRRKNRWDDRKPRLALQKAPQFGEDDGVVPHHCKYPWHLEHRRTQIWRRKTKNPVISWMHRMAILWAITLKQALLLFSCPPPVYFFLWGTWYSVFLHPLWVYWCSECQGYLEWWASAPLSSPHWGAFSSTNLVFPFISPVRAPMCILVSGLVVTWWHFCAIA